MKTQYPKIQIAIVEDNGVARANLRKLLMEMGYTNIGCYSHGREFKVALRQRNVDLILMDFHLGQHKNGVEVMQELQNMGLIKCTTSLIFVTSDRMPMIVGQIVDIHPDALVLKPYTIRNIEKTLNSALAINHYQRPILELMDEDETDKALSTLDKMLTLNEKPKFRTSMLKLKARLLIKSGSFAEATTLYKDVLAASDQVIWAKWGLIQSLFLSGDVAASEKILENMIGTHLTNDKACEWLARINIKKEKFSTAQEYMEKIKEGEMSLSAAKLKAYLYQAQDKMDEAISLLERKRESNREIRERFTDISFDLARCHMTVAENKGPGEKEESLKSARYFIGSAIRKNTDPTLLRKRNYMDAVVSVIEGDKKRAREILSQEGMEDIKNADISTLSDAVGAWSGVGEVTKASEILQDLEERIGKSQDENEKTVSGMLLQKNEEVLGNKKSRALAFNKDGLDLYKLAQYEKAMDYFYQAHILFPEEDAFSLNLLQCMVEARKGQHKKVYSIKLKNTLASVPHSKGNQKRLDEIIDKMSKQKDVHFISDLPPPDADGDGLEIIGSDD